MMVVAVADGITAKESRSEDCEKARSVSDSWTLEGGKFRALGSCPSSPMPRCRRSIACRSGLESLDGSCDQHNRGIW